MNIILVSGPHVLKLIEIMRSQLKFIHFFRFFYLLNFEEGLSEIYIEFSMREFTVDSPLSSSKLESSSFNADLIGIWSHLHYLIFDTHTIWIVFFYSRSFPKITRNYIKRYVYGLERFSLWILSIFFSFQDLLWAP